MHAPRRQLIGDARRLGRDTSRGMRAVQMAAAQAGRAAVAPRLRGRPRIARDAARRHDRRSRARPCRRAPGRSRLAGSCPGAPCRAPCRTGRRRDAPRPPCHDGRITSSMTALALAVCAVHGPLRVRLTSSVMPPAGRLSRQPLRRVAEPPRATARARIARLLASSTPSPSRSWLATEAEPRFRRSRSAHLGSPELPLARAAAPPGGGRGAVARDDRRPDPAVAAQAQRPVHDGQLRRPHDHRHRHVRVPAHDLSRSWRGPSRSRSPGRCRAAGARSGGSIPSGCAHADRGCRGLRRASPGWPDRRLRRRAIPTTSSTAGNTFPNSRARASTAVAEYFDARPVRCRRRRRRALEARGARRACQPTRQAAAHRHGVRRVRASTSARLPGIKAAARLPSGTSPRSTARRARSWSKASAGRAGSPSTTC